MNKQNLWIMNKILSVIFLVFAIAEFIGFLATGMKHCLFAAAVLIVISLLLRKELKQPARWN